MKKSIVFCVAFVLVIMTQIIGCVYADVKIVSIQIEDKGMINEKVTVTVENTGKVTREVDVRLYERTSTINPWTETDNVLGFSVAAGQKANISLQDTPGAKYKKVTTEDDAKQTDSRVTSDGGDHWKTEAVGGVWVPVDKFGLLAPYIGLASTILVATAATAIYVKRVKRRKEKQ